MIMDCWVNASNTEIHNRLSYDNSTEKEMMKLGFRPDNFDRAHERLDKMNKLFNERRNANPR